MAVEFAAVAPLLLAVVVGHARAVARLHRAEHAGDGRPRRAPGSPSLDRTGMMLEGQTANQKLINDVKNFLASSGIN